MHIAFLAFLYAVALASWPACAGTSVIGTPCSQLGRTQIDADGKNIVACLCSTTANCASSDYKWKSMTEGSLASGAISCPSGQIMTGIINGQPQCSSGK
ncbi:MAG: hypothetical protein WC464_08035 [Bdellovibrionales bacterium]